MLRTLVFKCLQMGAVAMLVMAFTLGSAGAQPAQAANATQVSAGWIPLAGSLYDSQTDSHINFNGLIHIVARWKFLSSGGAQLDVDVNLPAAGVTVTMDTGIPYTASGAGQSSILFPNDPVFPTDPVRFVVPSFLLVAVGATGPCRPIRFFRLTQFSRPIPYNHSDSGCSSTWCSPRRVFSISLPVPCRSSNSPTSARIETLVSLPSCASRPDS